MCFQVVRLSIGATSKDAGNPGGSLPDWTPLDCIRFDDQPQGCAAPSAKAQPVIIPVKPKSTPTMQLVEELLPNMRRVMAADRDLRELSLLWADDQFGHWLRRRR